MLYDVMKCYQWVLCLFGGDIYGRNSAAEQLHGVVKAGVQFGVSKYRLVTFLILYLVMRVLPFPSLCSQCRVQENSEGEPRHAEKEVHKRPGRRLT